MLIEPYARKERRENAGYSLSAVYGVVKVK